MKLTTSQNTFLQMKGISGQQKATGCYLSHLIVIAIVKVNIRQNGKDRVVVVHRLIALAYLPVPYIRNY